MALSRKQSREAAFRLLFGLAENNDGALTVGDLVNPQTLEIACNAGVENGGLGELPSGPELEYIKNLCAACVQNIERIDEIIKQYSKGFSFDRIFKTDLTALRMGIAEMKFFDGTPPVVAVNVAVEIAKKYGTEKSGGFVNGILAAVMDGK